MHLLRRQKVGEAGAERVGGVVRDAYDAAVVQRLQRDGRIFLSSTSHDLHEHRRRVDAAIARLQQQSVRMETFGAEPRTPLETCLERVADADALVVIVAHRYGWVPEDQEHNSEGKSITWLECEEATANGKHILAFVVDDSADWPRELREEAELDRAAHLDDYD